MITVHEQKLITFEDAKKYLSLKDSKLRSMVFKKEIPVIRIGRLLRFEKARLDLWLEGLASN